MAKERRHLVFGALGIFTALSICFVAIVTNRDALASSIITSSAALCAAYVAWSALQTQSKNRNEDYFRQTERLKREYIRWIFISTENYLHNCMSIHSFSKHLIGLDRPAVEIIVNGMRANVPSLPDAFLDKQTYYHLDRDSSAAVRDLFQNHNIFRQYLLITAGNLPSFDAIVLSKFSAKGCLMCDKLLTRIAGEGEFTYQGLAESYKAELSASAEMDVSSGEASTPLSAETATKRWGDWLSSWAIRK